MKIRQAFLVIFLCLTAASVFGKTATNTLYFGSAGFAVSEGILIAGLRSTASPGDTGFYFGSDLSLGIPLPFITLIHTTASHQCPARTIYS